MYKRQLLDRATKAAEYPTLSEMSRNEVPSWMVGAADVRIIFLQIIGGRVDRSISMTWSKNCSGSARTSGSARRSAATAVAAE